MLQHWTGAGWRCVEAVNLYLPCTCAVLYEPTLAFQRLLSKADLVFPADDKEAFDDLRVLSQA